MISTTLVVSGMSCGHCVQSISDELRGVDGVTAVEVDLQTGRVTVGSTGELPEPEVRAAVENAGYEVTAWSGAVGADSAPHPVP